MALHVSLKIVSPQQTSGTTSITYSLPPTAWVLHYLGVQMELGIVGLINMVGTYTEKRNYTYIHKMEVGSYSGHKILCKLITP